MKKPITQLTNISGHKEARIEGILCFVMFFFGGIAAAIAGCLLIWGGLALIDGDWNYWPLIFLDVPRLFLSYLSDVKFVEMLLFDLGFGLLTAGAALCLVSIIVIPIGILFGILLIMLAFSVRSENKLEKRDFKRKRKDRLDEYTDIKEDKDE